MGWHRLPFRRVAKERSGHCTVESYRPRKPQQTSLPCMMHSKMPWPWHFDASPVLSVRRPPVSHAEKPPLCFFSSRCTHLDVIILPPYCSPYGPCPATHRSLTYTIHTTHSCSPQVRCIHGLLTGTCRSPRGLPSSIPGGQGGFRLRRKGWNNICTLCLTASAGRQASQGWYHNIGCLSRPDSYVITSQLYWGYRRKVATMTHEAATFNLC
jgi:hypothetical protein